MIVRNTDNFLELGTADSLRESVSGASFIMQNVSAVLSDPADPTERPDFVTALARGLSVIRSFGPDRSQMSLADIAKRVNLPRATVRRSLITLETLGYIESDGRRFALSPKVLALGNSYLSSSPLPRTVQPMLERLAESSGEACWAAILDDDEVLLVAGAKKNRLLSAGLSVGSRMPAFCSALGRVLLAGLPEQRLDAYFAKVALRNFTSRTMTDYGAVRRAVRDAKANGYAIADGELESGLCSIAIPVVNHKGQLIASLNAVAPSSRVRGAEMIERFMPQLKTIADDLQPILH
jgi:IclR family transcriptional regulator, pca regulon regulatory protein